MTAEEVRQHVEGYSGRAMLAMLGFRAEFRMVKKDFCVYVTLDVPDTDDESEYFTIWAFHRIPHPHQPVDIDRAIQQALLECFQHEIGECLQHRDRLPLYPHGRSRRVREKT